MDAAAESKYKPPAIRTVWRAGCLHARLPLEICELIVGCLSDVYRSTIANCALVCYAWFGFSQRLLFEIVELYKPREWACFRGLLLQPPLGFTQLLPRVRELYITPVDSDAAKEMTMPEEEAHLQDADLLPTVRCFSGLTRLEFENVNWELQWFGSVFLACPTGPTGYFQSLTQLYLMNCSFVSTGQIQRLMQSFHGLSTLCLYDVGLQDSSPAPAQVSADGPHLKTLIVQSCDDNRMEFMEWLIATGSVRTLSAFEWIPFVLDSESDDDLVDLLGEIGGTLERIVMHVCSIEPIEMLFSCGSLKSLNIQRYVFSLEDRDVDLLKGFLTGLSTQQLEKLHLSVVQEAGDSSKTDWVCDLRPLQEVDDVLSQPQFRKLKSFGVRVTVTPPPGYDYDMRTITDLHFIPQAECTDVIMDDKEAPQDDLESWVQKERLNPSIQLALRNCASRGILDAHGYIEC